MDACSPSSLLPVFSLVATVDLRTKLSGGGEEEALLCTVAIGQRGEVVVVSDDFLVRRRSDYL